MLARIRVRRWCIETIELVFLAAIQHLPARQRVVFIARDVMGWSAKATATLLGARGVGQERPAAGPRRHEAAAAPASDDWGVGRSRSATASGRCCGATSTPTSTTTSKRWPRCSPRICGSPIRRSPWSDAGSVHPGDQEFAPPGDYRFVATSANLQPAVAIYLRAPGAPVSWLTALEVLRIEGGEITEIVDFDLPELYPVFGLALTFP